MLAKEQFEKQFKEINHDPKGRKHSFQKKVT